LRSRDCPTGLEVECAGGCGYREVLADFTREDFERGDLAATGNEPLKTLCDATLAQITNPPGRIYEKHALIVSPTTELLKAAQTIVDAAKAGKLPAG
jgi:hypothetical protein